MKLCSHFQVLNQTSEPPKLCSGFHISWWGFESVLPEGGGKRWGLASAAAPTSSLGPNQVTLQEEFPYGARDKGAASLSKHQVAAGALMMLVTWGSLNLNCLERDRRVSKTNLLATHTLSVWGDHTSHPFSLLHGMTFIFFFIALFKLLPCFPFEDLVYFVLTVDRL